MTAPSRVPDRARLATLACAGAALAGMVTAQTATGDWQFRASFAGYFPSLSGSLTFPTGTSSGIDAETADLFRHPEFAPTASFEAQHGGWGAFTEFIHLRSSGSVTNSPSLGGGGMSLPPGVTSNASLELECSVWTIAGQYRLVDNPDHHMDLFGGVRVFDLHGDLDYAFSADFGPFSGPLRSGSSSIDHHSLDPIIGFKGRLGWGADHPWFVPFYADIGIGESRLTWQVCAGIGCTVGPCDVLLTWRHLAYDFDSGPVGDFRLSGPSIGIALRF